MSKLKKIKNGGGGFNTTAKNETVYKKFMIYSFLLQKRAIFVAFPFPTKSFILFFFF